METNYMQITAKEAKNIMDHETDYIILDVRTEEEFNEGHIDGAIFENLTNADFNIIEANYDEGMLMCNASYPFLLK